MIDTTILQQSILKAKYRNPLGKLVHRDKIDPPEGTWIFAYDKHKSKHEGNQGRQKKGVQGAVCRRKASGPW